MAVIEGSDVFVIEENSCLEKDSRIEWTEWTERTMRGPGRNEKALE
jgi:hypothetical protein